MKHLFIFITVFCVCFYNTVYAQVKAIDSMFTSLHQQGVFNGNVLLADRGRVVYERSFGKADFAAGTSNQPDSRYNLASISKTFTAVGVLQLTAKNRIDTQKTLQHYFPDFPYPNIRVTHLLNHTSGLPDLELYEEVVKAHPDTVIHNKDVISLLRKWKKGLYAEPGERWGYCNTNYQLLALLIEKTSGLSFDNYMRRYIFKPAGLQHTYVRMAGQPADPKLVTSHLIAHRYDGRQVDVTTMPRFKYTLHNLGYTLGDNNIVTTTGDLLKFSQALFNGKLISRAALAAASAPARLRSGKVFYEDDKSSYGHGLVIYPDKGFGTAVGHDGYNDGLFTLLYHLPATGQTFIMYDNKGGDQPFEVTTAATALLNRKPAKPLNFKILLSDSYGKVLMQKGADEAMTFFNQHMYDTAHYAYSKRSFNLLGYDFLKSQHLIQALEVFKINTLLYPKESSVYDSYGEALAAAGKKEAAILMYQKSLELDPRNVPGKKMLESLLNSK